MSAGDLVQGSTGTTEENQLSIQHRSTSKGLRRLAGIATIAATSVTLAACGSSSSNDSAGSGGGAASAGGSGSKEIVIFLPPTSDPYAAHWLEAQKAEAEKNGYKVRAIQTASASEAAAQVQQVLGGGKPAAFVWWPVQAKAQVASLAALKQSGVPVFQGNQLPVPGSEKLITAFIGVSDTLNGESSGKGAILARDALKKSGKLHSPGGNVLVVALPAGYGATTDRLAGFKKATAGSGMKILTVGNAGGFSAQDAFTTASQLIAANKSKGIDIVYAQMDDYANGAVRALEQAGLKPGKDVMVVGGSCHGDESNVENGKIFNTSIQGAAMEGEFTMKTVLQYLKNPKVDDKTYVAPNTADAAPALPETISKMNIISTPMVTAADYKGSKLWGKTAADLCTF
jgi:ABC-type sugar transport system substrate-binding protein